MRRGIVKSAVSRWTTDVAKATLDAQEASGMSILEFARERGIDAQRLYFWRRRLSADSKAGAFVEVVRSASATASPASQIEVLLRSGDVIRVIGAVDAARFRDVVEVLRTC